MLGKEVAAVRPDTLKGMAVVSIADAARLGRVGEVLVDVGGRRAAALAVQAPEERLILPFDQIASIGSDAVTVASADALQVGTLHGAVAGLAASAELLGRKVVDDSGRLIGALSTIEFDPRDGHITELAVHQGGLLGMGGTTYAVPAGAIQSVGTELIVVAAGGVEQPAR